MTERVNMSVCFAGMSIGLSVPQDFVPSLHRELEPFFIFLPEPGPPSQSLAKLNVHIAEFDKSNLPAAMPVTMKIDSSLYKHLASEGQRWGDASRFVIYIAVSQTWVVFDKQAGQIDLYQTAMPACLMETIRLIKSLYTPALELAGAVQLHGSAVAAEGGCVLLLGDMWHGKTTLLLEMLSQFNVSQLSCDTVVLFESPEGKMTVSGWPSPFSVSHGTMADFPELHPFFPAERGNASYGQLWQERKKSVLTSVEVVQRFGTNLVPNATRVDVCLLITYAPEKPTQIQKVEDSSLLRQALDIVCLGSRDPIYHNWHQFFACPEHMLEASLARWSQRLLENCQVYAMTWAPSATSLMKRVPALARLHKNLPNILHLSKTARRNG